MTRLTTHAAALVLSLTTTLAMLSGMDALATQPHGAPVAQAAAAEAPATQIVTITGKRVAQG